MSIELQLRRYRFSATQTVGELRYDGKSFGYTIEDPDRGLTQGMTESEMRALQVRADTCIAAGYWPIVLRDSGKFGPETLTVLCLANRLIRVHPGKDERWTEGCVIPGLRLVESASGARLDGSENAVRWLEDQLRPHLRAGNDAWLRIERDPAAWAAAPFNPRRA